MRQTLPTARLPAVGWADVYPWFIADQYIDITDVPDGKYAIVVRQDVENHVLEKDTSNNTAMGCVQINGDDAVEIPCGSVKGKGRQGWGWIDDCFTGIWTGDGPDAILRGTMWREGSFTFTGPVGGVIFEQEIVGGTGDFAGSRGTFTAAPAFMGPSGVGVGGYSGQWIRGNGSGGDDPIPDCSQPRELPASN